MERIHKVNDYAKRAQQVLPPDVYTYFSTGAEEEITMHENETAFKRLSLLTKQMKGGASLTLKTRILGHEVGLPFGFAPSAMHKLAHPRGEAVTAQVAFKEDLCFTLSTLSTVSLSEIQQQNRTGIRFLQLYIVKNREVTETMVRLAEKYGFSGLVITVDAQVIGKRIQDERNKFISPNGIKLEIIEEIQNSMKEKSTDTYQRRYWTQQRDLSLDWNFITWLKSITTLPIILKGIMSVDDAILSCEHDIDAIWVSNHGGRQLDCVSATIDVLPEIARVVKEKYPQVEVYVDGGVRKGSDVFKCLAMGADYVFLGRPVVFSLVMGEQGLSNMVGIMKEELQIQMKEAGVSTVDEIKGCSGSANLSLLKSKL